MAAKSKTSRKTATGTKAGKSASKAAGSGAGKGAVGALKSALSKLVKPAAEKTTKATQATKAAGSGATKKAAAKSVRKAAAGTGAKPARTAAAKTASGTAAKKVAGTKAAKPATRKAVKKAAAPAKAAGTASKEAPRKKAAARGGARPSPGAGPSTGSEARKPMATTSKQHPPAERPAPAQGVRARGVKPARPRDEMAMIPPPPLTGIRVELPEGYEPTAGDGEYMNPMHLEYFRRKLLAWRAELVEESKQTIDHLREEVRDVGDEAERATREAENALELRTRDRYRKLIAKIDKALKRIEDGSYGYCEETGEEIGIERLKARPIATLCLDAQERWEHKQKLMGD